MYKVVLRMLFEWVKIMVFLPFLLLCCLAWGVLALIWKTCGCGTVKDFYEITNARRVLDSINERMNYVKTGIQGASQQ